jgi:hypothetical protein
MLTVNKFMLLPSSIRLKSRYKFRESIFQKVMHASFIYFAFSELKRKGGQDKKLVVLVLLYIILYFKQIALGTG